MIAPGKNLVAGPTPGAQTRKLSATQISLLANVFLTTLKFIVGFTSGSVSVLSEAAHSSADIVASALALVAIRVASLPPDEKHAYGHGKVESLFSLGEALLLFSAAMYIIYEAVARLFSHSQPQKVGWGMVIMTVSALLNLFISRYLFRIAKETDSEALRAEAENHRADIYAAAGVFAGLGLVYLTGYSIFDPLMALVVSLMILRSAVSIAWTAGGTLLDGQLPSEDTDKVKAAIDATDSVLGYHKLRTRKSGAVRFVDAHILIDDELTFQEAHDLTEEIEDNIRALLPHAQVTLHSEPFRDEVRHQQEAHAEAERVAIDAAIAKAERLQREKAALK